MDILKNNIVVGLGIAIAATALAPLLLPALGGAGRPLAKSLVKSGLALYDKGRETLALAGESLEDLMAEIRADDAAQADAAQEQPVHDHAGDTHFRTRGNGTSPEAAAQAAGTVGI